MKKFFILIPIFLLVVVCFIFMLVSIPTNQAQASETNIYYWKVTLFDIDGKVIKEIKTKCNCVNIDEGVINIYDCCYHKLKNPEEYYFKGNYMAEKYLYDGEE